MPEIDKARIMLQLYEGRSVAIYKTTVVLPDVEGEFYGDHIIA